jgi:hypothetical protein
VEQDDAKDILGYLAYLERKPRERGKVDEIPLMLEGFDDEEEVLRLAMKTSQEHPPSPQALPLCVASVM